MLAQLKLHECSLADAMDALNDYAENPTKMEVFQVTAVDALDDALSVLERETY